MGSIHLHLMGHNMIIPLMNNSGIAWGEDDRGQEYPEGRRGRRAHHWHVKDTSTL